MLDLLGFPVVLFSAEFAERFDPVGLRHGEHHGIV
jgi:hypothetical protein